MKCFPATKRDNELGIMRCEISAEDMELLEYASEALEKLAIIEDALEVKGFYSPWLSVPDRPTLTRDSSQLLHKFQVGWDSGDFDKMIESGEVEIAS